MSNIKSLRILPVLILLLLVAACSENSSVLAPQATDETTSLDPFAGEEAHRDYLALQKSAPGYSYEIAVTGEINLATGGTIEGFAPSWPDQSGHFAYTVLPGAIDPASLPDPTVDKVLITVWVPVYETDFPGPEVAMPMVLEPHGLNYLPSHDATLSASYHPSLRPSFRDSGYYVYCIDENQPSDISIGVAAPVTFEDFGDDFDRSTRIQASIPHHSRWVVDNSDDDPEDTTGG